MSVAFHKKNRTFPRADDDHFMNERMKEHAIADCKIELLIIEETMLGIGAIEEGEREFVVVGEEIKYRSELCAL